MNEKIHGAEQYNRSVDFVQHHQNASASESNKDQWEKKNNSTERSEISKKEYLTISWQYFQQHAQQRIGYFNFFLLFSSFLTAAMVASIKEKETILSIIGIALGLIQIIISFIFWKIDERNKTLTKNGEDAIKKLEAECLAFDPSFPILFIAEEKQTEAQKATDKFAHRGWFSKQYSHSKSFRAIFLLFALWGAIEVIVCIIQLILF